MAGIRQTKIPTCAERLTMIKEVLLRFHPEPREAFMSAAAKLDAVRQLLQNAFPKGTIKEDVDPDEIGRRFTVTCQGARYITVISREFLDSHAPERIADKLNSFLLIEHLRDMKDTTVIVTNGGLSL
jgi:hypothetical protein